jgi:NADPH-dependent F420 reductase
MESENTEMIKKIAILGGTGKEGKGLAFRWVTAGYEVIIGSRVVEKAQNAVNELKQILDPNKQELLKGSTNDTAADEADIIVLTVPFEAHKVMLETLKDQIKNKILIDVTVPIVPPKFTKVQMPPAGSAAQEALEILGFEAKVASAFQNISYERLLNEKDIECDVLVSGTDKETREMVLKLVDDAGMIGWDAGPIENSVVAEGLTSILININKQFGSHTAGIKITGVNRS